MVDEKRLREIVRDMDEGEVVMGRDIRNMLGVSQEERKELRETLRRFCDLGLLERLGPKVFRKPRKLKAGATGAPAREAGRRGRGGATEGEKARGRVATGVVYGHRAGHATVVLSDTDGEKVAVRSYDLGGAIHGDTVKVELMESRQRGGARPGRGGQGKTAASARGRITAVLEREAARVPGIFQFRRGGSFVIPDDPRFPDFIPVGGEETMGAADGEAVVVELPRPVVPGDPRVVSGRVIEVLGVPGEPEAEIEKIILMHALLTEFSELALAEAEGWEELLPEEELDRRLDLRERPLVTIDGKDARDFDDAVMVDRRPGGGFTLTVAIADVAHYVPEGSALDEDASSRGNSVYFPQRVIPMLPARLSNELCSLMPEVDRLCMVAILDVEEDGAISSARFAEGVMRSHARLTYEQVAGVIDEDDGEEVEDADLAERWGEHLKTMLECAKCLNGARKRLGTLDFDIPEPEVLFREDSSIPTGIGLRSRNWAHRLVEEFMLAANGAVGSHLAALDLPAIYRIHDRPNPDKLAVFANMAGAMGHPFTAMQKDREVSLLDLGKFLETLDKEGAGPMLHRLALRSMAKAVYATEDIGHFGLGTEEYVHFTSPIRRYPDLMVHRVIKAHLQNIPGEGGSGSKKKNRMDRATDRVAEKSAFGGARLQAVADRCTSSEQKAMAAEYAALDYYRAYSVKDRVGEVFTGIISGVTGFGFFVELREPFIDGLVRVDDLNDDFYEFDGERMMLLGRRTKRRFRIGDQVEVELKSVNLQRRQIDFAITDIQKSGGRGGRDGGRTGGRTRG